MNTTQKANWPKHYFQALLARWLAKRLPASSSVTLTHKNIFILPSGFGLLWIGLILLLYLFGTNYQNNLVIGLSILLLSLLNTCLYYSYKNLAGLTLSSLPPPQAYSGETLSFPIALSSSHHAFEISINYPNNRAKVMSELQRHPQKALVPFDTKRRGPLVPGRVKVESRYPLGLCRAWSYVDLANSQVIFANPVPTDVTLSSADVADNALQPQGRFISGVDEFKGLKEHVLGESLKQVAWKQWAQGRGMLTKEFQQPQGLPVWLTLTRLDSDSLELQLCHLSWQIDKLSERGQIFGLKLGHQHIPPANGELHRIACQTALALVPHVTPQEGHYV